MSSTISTETGVLANMNHQHHRLMSSVLNLQNTCSMAGSQATPVRPLPGLPVGEIEVPRVTNGEDLVMPITVVISTVGAL